MQFIETESYFLDYKKLNQEANHESFERQYTLYYINQPNKQDPTLIHKVFSFINQKINDKLKIISKNKPLKLNQ